MTTEQRLDDCSGCTDKYSEGTHAMHTKQHPCKEGGDPDCGYCFPSPQTTNERVEEIVREFGRKFNIAYVKDKGFASLGAEIQDFIRTALTTYTASLIEDAMERIEGRKFGRRRQKKGEPLREIFNDIGKKNYNAALDEAITILRVLQNDV